MIWTPEPFLDCILVNSSVLHLPPRILQLDLASKASSMGQWLRKKKKKSACCPSLAA